MNRLTPDLLRELVAEARLAPSIHNIQPTRWRLLADGLLALVDDSTVRAPVADPSGHDVRLSHGAALEGMSIALNRRGLRIADVVFAEQALSPRYSSLCTLTIGDGTDPDPLLANVMLRTAWRGTFVPAPENDTALAQLAASRNDAICINDRHAITEIVDWADQAELSFLRKNEHRRELLTWMRLSPSHPLYLQNGLNREALALNAFEAAGASFVLGRLFPTLDRIGVAAPLVSDRAKTSSAAGIILFCRPKGEDPLISGRHFYRLWLEINRAGLAACPISSLADHPAFNDKLRKVGKVGEDRRLVNVFRVGRPAKPQPLRHFRLPVDQLIV